MCCRSLGPRHAPRWWQKSATDGRKHWAASSRDWKMEDLSGLRVLYFLILIILISYFYIHTYYSVWNVQIRVTLMLWLYSWVTLVIIVNLYEVVVFCSEYRHRIWRILWWKFEAPFEALPLIFASVGSLKDVLKTHRNHFVYFSLPSCWSYLTLEYSWWVPRIWLSHHPTGLNTSSVFYSVSEGAASSAISCGRAMQWQVAMHLALQMLEVQF